MILQDIKEEKDKIRKELKIKCSKMEVAKKNVGNLAICKTLIELSVFKDAELIALYAAIEDEVDLSLLLTEAIKKGKRVCFPKFVTRSKSNDLPGYEMAEINNIDNLKVGKYGILEPGQKCRVCKREEIDVWVVPGAAFALDGTRLGRGGGVYDRLLKNADGFKIGVLFNAQMKDSLPSEKHDIKMNMLISERQIIEI